MSASSVALPADYIPEPVQLGQRLQRIRKRSGRTQADVAEALGLSRPSVAAIEAGQRGIDARLLQTLAAAYQVPISELVREPEVPVALQAQFRLPAEAADAEKEQLERAIGTLEHLAERYLSLESVTESPLRGSPVPRYTYEARRIVQDAEHTADAERRRLGLSDGPVLKLRELLEREGGLRIFHVPLPGQVAGLYGRSPEAGPCIAINAHHAAVRQRWSLAHEFAHFLTRLAQPEVTRVSGYQRLPEQERFAERFAGAFLMPASGLERRIREVQREGRKVTVADLLLIADEYEVSLQALVLRLEDLRVVPAGTWDRLGHSGANIRAASAVLGLVRPRPDTMTFPRRYILLALEAYDRELLTERELARLLDADRLTVREVVEQFAHGADTIAPGDSAELQLSESMHVDQPA